MSFSAKKDINYMKKKCVKYALYLIFSICISTYSMQVYLLLDERVFTVLDRFDYEELNQKLISLMSMSALCLVDQNKLSVSSRSPRRIMSRCLAHFRCITIVHGIIYF